MSPKLFLILTAVLLLGLLAGAVVYPATEWEGVDAVVVEKHAADLGQEASPPLLNLQGDLQLFVFAMGGAIGGFLAGYCWRDLFGAAARQPVDDAL